MEYKNPGGVCIETFKEDAIFISADYPGYAGSGIEILIFSFQLTIEEVVELFSVRKATDLKKIEPAHLLELYRKGLAEIICLTDPEQESVLFIKLDSSGHFLVEDNERKCKCVKKFPDRAEGIIKYTQNYYATKKQLQ